VSTSIILGFGPQPVDFFGKATKVCGKDAVLDPDVARMAGANFAIGMPDDLAKLRKLLEAGAVQQAQQDNPGLSEAAARWLASGERGLSSNTIFTHLTGINALRGDHKDHPYDPSDFRRCRLLLEQVPELVPLFPKMAEVSAAWKDLVYLWGDICKAMDEEAPKWREGHGQSCPATYQLIKRAIGR
jgi:hypothetical protein